MPIELTAAEVPIPTGPVAGVALGDCTDTTTTAPASTAFETGEKGTVAEKLNQALAALANAAAYGGNGFGVIDGFALTAGTGLTLNIAEGRAQILGIVEYAGGTKTLPDDATLAYVWILQNGTIEAVADDITPPENTAVYLGAISTAAGDIVSDHDTSGVCYLGSGLLYRETADRGAPDDAPAATARYLTKTLAGLYLWTGDAYKPQGIPVNQETITATKTLTDLDAQRQILTPSGATRKVLMPAVAAIDAPAFEVHNGATSGAFALTIRDSADAFTIATLANGERVTVPPRYGASSGSGTYPATVIAPDP